MLERRNWRHFDFWLIAAILVLTAGGVAMIYSSARNDSEISRTPVDQTITALAGLLLLLLLSLIDYSLFRSFTFLLYGGTLLALALVLVPGLGVAQNGAQRWFRFAGFDVQPAELAKLTLGLAMAGYISSREGKGSYLKTVFWSFILITPCIGLILAQPNLSSAVIILFMWLAMIFVGGLRNSHAAVMTLTGVVMLLVIVLLHFRVQDLCLRPTPAKDKSSGRVTDCLGIIPEYQISRVQALLNGDQPVSDGSDYQSKNALIALGGGGLTGQGFGQGGQTQGRYLPARHTDFIFSVIGEELGFVGCVVVIGLLLFIIFRTLLAAWKSHDTFGRLLCVSVAAVFFLQTYTNIGMQVQLLPVTGVVLPFVSYGRSNLIAQLVAIGLVESVSMRYKRLQF